MKVSEMGEFGLVEMIADVLEVGHPGNSRGVLLDIGDDTAAWKPGSAVELVTTDTMVEDVHFRIETTSYRDLGWKALAINLSDIAAMGECRDTPWCRWGLARTRKGSLWWKCTEG